MSRTPRIYVAEPSTRHMMLPPMVVDCSLLSAALFEETARDAALGQMLGKALHAPHLLDHEIVSVAMKKRRLGWDGEAVRWALVNYASMNVQLHATEIAPQIALAEQYKLSGYDAAYLWLAGQMKAPLATFDEKLAKAASAHLSSLT